MIAIKENYYNVEKHNTREEYNALYLNLLSSLYNQLTCSKSVIHMQLKYL